MLDGCPAASISLDSVTLRGQVAAGGGIVWVEVAVIGGTKRSTTYLEPKGSETTAISNPQWKVESAATVLSVPLEEQGTGVAVRFSVVDCRRLPCRPVRS